MKRLVATTLASTFVSAIAACAGSTQSTASNPPPEPTIATEAPVTEASTTEPVAPAEPPPPPPIDPLTLSGSLSTSIGSPNDGHIEGAIAFPDEGPGYRLNPNRPNEGGRFGTVETVQAIIRAAAVVEEAMPGSKLVFNDTSLEHGGPIVHHGSHQAGRDIDVLFFIEDTEGHPLPSKGVPIDPRGRGIDFNDLVDPSDDRDVRIDLPRTWRFVQALIEPEDSLVQRIFVVEHLRTMLLEEARRQHAPRRVVTLFEDATCQPSAPHDDHLHVRFFCTGEDIGAGCEDGAPMYPWRRRQLIEEGVEPAMATMRRRPRGDGESTTNLHPEPPPMHARVRAFLDERERTWGQQPHPHRRYCR